MSDDMRSGFLDELATATKHNLIPGAIEIYLKALADIDTGTLAEACSRLMQTARYFPSVAEIREQARMIHADEKRLEQAQPYSRKEWIPQPRAELWMAHLRETIHALKHGLPRPTPPEPLDTSRVTFQCYHCQDTGFVRVCECGQKKSCRMCRYEYFQDCSCRPPRPEPVKTQAVRHGRGR